MPSVEAVPRPRRRPHPHSRPRPRPLVLAAAGVTAALVTTALPAAPATAAPTTTGSPVVAGAGRTSRISLTSAGAQATDHSLRPSVDATGRYVVFESSAPLVPGDTNAAPDVYLRDRAARTTARISLRDHTTQLSEGSGSPAISASGSHVLFQSYASDLVPGDTNDQPDVFLRELATGRTTRVNVSGSGAQANEVTFPGAVSADGRYVTFSSYASNLVPGDTNGSLDAFVRDVWSGATTRLLPPDMPTEGGEPGDGPVVSADGRYVVFRSDIGALAQTPRIYVRELRTGVTRRVDLSSRGAPANDVNGFPTISADGRYVLFGSHASNLVPGDTNGVGDVFVRDRWTDTTTRISVSATGAQANGGSGEGVISADGRYVAYGSIASNLVPGDTNGVGDVLVHDRRTGAVVRASVSWSGASGDDRADAPAISADGRQVVFLSAATNLVPGDTNGVDDVFVRDLR